MVFGRILLKILVVFVLCLAVVAQEKKETSVEWFDASGLTVEGKGWKDTKNFYDRLPARAENKVRSAVWNLSQNSAGISIRFSTDSREISLRWKLRGQLLSLPNMAAMSVSGLDLYVKENGRWRWAAVGRADKFPINERKVIANMTRQNREFLLYLPLYNGVESVEIGIEPDAKISKSENRYANLKPIVFYGTSIVQGASASRAGLSYPAILSRRLNVSSTNLGFSGNCKAEPELADLIAEIDAAIYFLDCLPNLSSGIEVEEKIPNFIKILRAKRPNTPIILVENILYPDIFLETKKRETVESKNRGLQNVYKNLLKQREKNIFYISAQNLIGNDGEATIDGVHPTDLGFVRMADAFEPIIRRILTKSRQAKVF